MLKDEEIEFEKRSENGALFVEQVISFLKINIPEYVFKINTKKPDAVEGDILVYNVNNIFIAGIDCKYSECISLKSIVQFKGAKTAIAHRAVYISPFHLIAHQNVLINQVFEKLYQEYSDLNLHLSDLLTSVYFMNNYISNKEVKSEYFQKMSSGHLGFNVDKTIKTAVLYEGHWQSEEYLRILRLFLKNKNDIILRLKD